MKKYYLLLALLICAICVTFASCGGLSNSGENNENNVEDGGAEDTLDGENGENSDTDPLPDNCIIFYVGEEKYSVLDLSTGTPDFPASPVADNKIFDCWTDDMGNEITQIDSNLSGRVSYFAKWITIICNKSDLLAVSGNNKYKLAYDIDLGGTEWTPISNFDGEIDGDGHKIFNFVINGSYCGLFGQSRAIFKNLAVTDFTFNVKGDSAEVGGITVSLLAGSIEDCYAEGEVIVDNLHTWATVGGIVCFNQQSVIKNCTSRVNIRVTKSEVTIGGILGSDVNYAEESIIQNCKASGKITLTDSRGRVGGIVADSKNGVCGSSYNGEISLMTTDSVSDGIVYTVMVGGIAGQCTSVISDSYSTANISAYDIKADGTIGDCKVGGIVGAMCGSVKNCFSTGDISGEDSVGGIIGNCYQTSEISECYSSGKITSRNYSGGIVGDNGGKLTVVDCYSLGDIVAEGRGYTCSGGIVGRGSTTSVTNCYSRGNVYSCAENPDITAESFASGIIAEGGANIANCYSLGSLTSYAENANTTIAYASPIDSSASPSQISNCYYAEGQEYFLRANNYQEYDNSMAESVDAQTICTSDFHTSTLGWNSDIWSFDGEYPTLKNMPQIKE